MRFVSRHLGLYVGLTFLNGYLEAVAKQLCWDQMTSQNRCPGFFDKGKSVYSISTS